MPIGAPSFHQGYAFGTSYQSVSSQRQPWRPSRECCPVTTWYNWGMFYPFLNRFYQFLTTPQMHHVYIQCDNAPERALHLTGEEQCLFTGFTEERPVTLLSSLALLGVLARSLQLTVNENLSWLWVSFHEKRLSSSFSRLFRTSTIDFGLTLGNPSIINYPKITKARNLRPLDPPFFSSPD